MRDNMMQNVETVRFEEDDNVVEIAVQDADQTQFISDDESDPDDNSENSEIEDGEVTEQETNEISEPSSPDKRIVKLKMSRRSMEQKIEEQNYKLQEMSSTLKTMQEMMMKQGGFDTAVSSGNKQKGKVKPK